MSTKERAAANCSDGKEADVLYDFEPLLAYIGPRIEELCAKKGISKYRLALRSGVTDGNISRYVDGSRIPTIETIAKLCFGFDITLSEFFENMPGQEKVSSNDPRELLLEIWKKLDQGGQRSLLSFGKYLADAEENK
ncbi:MAG: helix-turn-helix transcriptional regulator [Lachnospiraceae bacterium]|nr:helix-turn-helix transcriptional regulator [Lachnospiraceae bacterium]